MVSLEVVPSSLHKFLRKSHCCFLHKEGPVAPPCIPKSDEWFDMGVVERDSLSIHLSVYRWVIRVAVDTTIHINVVPTASLSCVASV